MSSRNLVLIKVEQSLILLMMMKQAPGIAVLALEDLYRDLSNHLIETVCQPAMHAIIVSRLSEADLLNKKMLTYHL